MVLVRHPTNFVGSWHVSVRTKTFYTGYSGTVVPVTAVLPEEGKEKKCSVAYLVVIVDGLLLFIKMYIHLSAHIVQPVKFRLEGRAGRKEGGPSPDGGVL